MIMMNPWLFDYDADLFACLFQVVFDQSTDVLACLFFQQQKSTTCIISGSIGIGRSIDDDLNIIEGVSAYLFFQQKVYQSQLPQKAGLPSKCDDNPSKYIDNNTKVEETSEGEETGRTKARLLLKISPYTMADLRR